jgi:hypothetical protein
MSTSFLYYGTMVLHLMCHACGIFAIDFTHVRLVDYSFKSGNFLFRTGDPSNQTSGIAYDELVTMFALRAKEAGQSFPQTFRLIDLSFWTTEEQKVEDESRFFQTHPCLGQLFHWPLYGIDDGALKVGCQNNGIANCQSTQPAYFDVHDLKVMASHFLEWGDNSNLFQHVAATHDWLITRSNISQVIFGHCTCGCDRTGAFFGAYYMQYLNRSFSQTMKYSERIPFRHIEYGMQIYVQWYCTYLHATNPLNFPALLDCTNCKPFVCGARRVQRLRSKSGAAA